MRHQRHRALRTLAARRLAHAPLLGAAALMSLGACREQRPAPELSDAGVDDPVRLDAGARPVPDAAPGPAAFQPICSPDGWCWDGAGLHNASLHAAAGSAPDDLWVAGELGLVLHFDGERWLSEWAPTRQTLRALCAQGGEVWAVGGAATVLHQVQHEWRVEAIPALPEAAELRAVSADEQGNVWVAGAGGVLFERVAGVWSRVEAGGAALNALWSSDGEAWAAGDAGTLLRRDPEAGWLPVESGTSQNLLALHGRGDDLWIAGNGGEIRRRDAETGSWQRPAGDGPAPQGQLTALSVGAERVYVANAAGQLFTWDETITCAVPGDAGAPHEPCPGWSAARSTGSELPILGLWARGDLTLAVGAYGSITRWDGELRRIESQGSRDNHLDVAGTPTGELWIAGDRLSRRGSDGRWHDVTRDSPRAIYAVQPLADRTLIAGTGGLARSYASEAWQDMDVRADAWLRALYADASGAWLVGSRGTAFGLLNGRLWTPLATPTDRDLLAIHGVPSGSVWAVGARGVSLRHDGVQWAAVPTGPDGGVSADLRGVFALAEDDVWAVGTAGTTLHWDGRLWTRVGEDAAFSLNAVWARSSDDVWAAGSGGTLLHYDGSEWHPEHSGSSQSLNALWGDGARLWVVGEHGTVLFKEID